MFYGSLQWKILNLLQYNWSCSSLSPINHRFSFSCVIFWHYYCTSWQCYIKLYKHGYIKHFQQHYTEHSALTGFWHIQRFRSKVSQLEADTDYFMTNTAPSASVVSPWFLKSLIWSRRSSSSKIMLSTGDISGRERTAGSSSESSSFNKRKISDHDFLLLSTLDLNLWC